MSFLKKHTSHCSSVTHSVFVTAFCYALFVSPACRSRPVTECRFETRSPDRVPQATVLRRCDDRGITDLQVGDSPTGFIEMCLRFRGHYVGKVGDDLVDFVRFRGNRGEAVESQSSEFPHPP